MVDVMNAFDWAFPPHVILECEAEYPGLIDDMMIEVWQRELVKGQVESQQKRKAGRDDDGMARLMKRFGVSEGTGDV